MVQRSKNPGMAQLADHARYRFQGQRGDVGHILP